MKKLVAKHIKQSYWGLGAFYLASDALISARYRLGDIGTTSGAAHAKLQVDESIRYVEEVFRDYSAYSGVSSFAGKVAEVGPGDNCGVGLLFLENGAESVDLVDRFYSQRNDAAQAAIYADMRKRRPFLARLLKNANLEDESTFPGIHRHYGPDASAEEFFVKNTGYSYIVSRAVFEHVQDPVLSLQRMAAALKPGGMLLHKVDLRDHGLFSGAFHELKFFEVPDILYKRMTRGSGRPNRVMAHRYDKCLKACGLAYEILVTRLAGVGDITPHVSFADIAPEKRERALAFVRSKRANFAASFRDASDEDLAVAGIFIVARKTQPDPH
jgi:SAM-dependent methyltransferase